jgi:hypothetical protein
MDIARWALGKSTLPNKVHTVGGRFGYSDQGETPNTVVSTFDYGDQTLVFEVRGLDTPEYTGVAIGNIVYGTEGYVVFSSNYALALAFDKAGNEVKKFSGGGDHFGNFVKAVRNRSVNDLNAPIVEGHLSSALCHLGNISYRLGEPAVPAKELTGLLASNKHGAEAVVRYLLINKDSEKPISHDYVAYYPYRMFCLQYTTQVENELKRLHGLAGKDHKYGIYTNNCISFVAKSLWGFGIFKDEHKQADILRYKTRSNAYPSNGGLFLVPDSLVKMVSHSPEWLKELVDDQSMVKTSGIPYKVAQAKNHNLPRRGECYMQLEDELRSNLGDAFLKEINSYIPKSNKRKKEKASQQSSQPQQNAWCTVS